MKATLPATTPKQARTEGYNVTLRFTEAEAAYLTAIASRFGWTLSQFVDGFIHGTLPLQKMYRHMPGTVTAETLRPEVLCPTLAARIERVASFNGLDVEAWLLAVIGSQLDAQEAQMIFDPHTGEVIGDARRVFQAIRL